MSKIKKIIPVVYIIAITALITIGCYIINIQSMSSDETYILYMILFLLGIGNFTGFIYFRYKFMGMSNTICNYAEKIMKGDFCLDIQNKESLTSKVVMELQKMSHILETKVEESKGTKDDIQELVSDITHQLKIPISNIRMYGDTLSENDITNEEKNKFIQIIQQQVIKLEFLINALTKMSRLESQMINLHIENNSILQTIVLAMSTMTRKANKKNIELHVDCRKSIYTKHDVKWTSEALENILDNAIKYTDENGKVMIQVFLREMFVEIQVIDTGKGIDPKHYNDIFKRFYREKNVAKSEGLGIGLYLTRQIISQQGGYITVKSKLQSGSIFTVFLPIK